ncbi:MAG: ribosome-associated translation inhibitor RaiA [Gemmatimonadetes bacterium]|uniref:Ribosome hibernation promoting factor n=1 Tax=Candidatus Kutchimonas denitrificans TaxID=3056748 RepID=A0AAE4Z8C5_9BACT|nr:ribosome-associated translation inhibitor RaiA [Gemmatimonadota bacterium]NIR75695.1 ribosome-associated translation inhibitor RaiA [Candidatus Kutchimonas denitrificans]NIS00308.1 ribosome-associated translation inhibitor RaiA [Gemmatimonadota bacterium]NIT65967.1 ribosome-associated translation inhibitor RaiA [Gemmatimonadota bacterium]NIU53671.1 ribosome-associated translation inhibitor RaiA [Gemmatimonadota bacterium]
MRISMTARHFELSDTLRRHVENRLAGLDKYHQRATRVEVTLTDEKREKRVEAHAFVDGDHDIHAEASASDFRTAVNRLSEKLGRQMKRRRDRRVNHKAPRLNEQIPTQEGVEGSES